jgi:hypothetical protein
MCSAAQRKILQLTIKKQLELTAFVQPREKFLNWRTKRTQIDCIAQPRSEIFWNWRTKELKLTVFVQPRSEIFLNWRTKSPQNGRYLFGRATNFGIGKQKQLKLCVFVQPRSENLLANNSTSN